MSEAVKFAVLVVVVVLACAYAIVLAARQHS